MPRSNNPSLGGPAALASLLVVALIIVEVSRYPDSLQGPGKQFIVADVALLLAYVAFSIWASRERRPRALDALTAAARAGLILGLVFIANHALESFAPNENKTAELARAAGSVLLMLGLFGTAGSLAWEHTRSLVWTAISGLWCASVAIPIALAFAFASNLAFEAHAAAQLREPFLASGMSDAGAFVVRNSLQAASELLVRMPIAALLLSVLGALANAWITTRSRAFVVASACLMPVVFIAGAAALWRANSLDRSSRPPFVMAGLLAAVTVLCLAHPVWSALFSDRRRR